MTNYHHKSIKKFCLSGQIHDESAIARLKIEYIRLVISDMKLDGYVPRIDIDPDFTISYNEEKEIFDFILSVHGIYVGRKQSEWIQGVDGTNPIYIPQNKLKEFSQGLESQSNQN
jgi:hypothetical protein